ncbi:PAS domain S-box protein, partial [bacterium]
LMVLVLWSFGLHRPGLEVHEAALEHFPVIALLAAVMPAMAVGLGTDARRATTRALRHSERGVRESLEHSPIGTMLMSLEGLCTFSNGALQRMLGYSHDELRTLPHEVLSHPEDIAAMRQRRQRLIERSIDSYEVERRILHKDGTWIWVRGAISLVRDEDGRPQHYIAQIESLQARRRAEQTLAEERERLRVTLGAIGDAVITTDTDSRITYMNDAACRLLGQTLEQVAQRRLRDVTSLTDPETLRRMPDLVGQCVLRGEVLRRDVPCVLHRPDSGASYVTAVVSPIQDPQGRITSIVVVLHDATEGFERTRDLRHRATHDSLTELANRVEFNRRLAEVFERSRLLETPAAVIAFDL